MTELEHARVCGSRCLGPMTFDTEAVGRRVTLSQRARRASREVTSFRHGLLFTSRPVKVREKVCLLVEHCVMSWDGTLCVGFTSVCPGSSPLPPMSIPDLTDTPGYCAVPVPEAACLPGSVIQFWMNDVGYLIIRVADGQKYCLKTEMDLDDPLWAMIDLYGQTNTVLLLGSEKKDLFGTRRSCAVVPPHPSRIKRCNVNIFTERRQHPENNYNNHILSPADEKTTDKIYFPTATRRIVRKRTGATWEVRLFLLRCAGQRTLPTPTECSQLTRAGLGIPIHEMPGGNIEKGSVDLLSTHTEFIRFICSSYPLISLESVGFHVAGADKSMRLVKLKANTLKDMKKQLGKNRLFIIPQMDIPLPSAASVPVLPSVTLTRPPTSPFSPPDPASAPLTPLRDRAGTTTGVELNSSLEDLDITSLLRMVQHEYLNPNDEVKVVIWRKRLLESAIKALSRRNFSWTKIPHIEFVGEDAIDCGGPQREFFRLLMIEVQTSLGIFEGRPGQVILTYDQTALDQHKYLNAGKLIAWSLAHGRPGIKALDPCLFQLMCGQETQLEDFDWHILPDADVQEKVQRILQCKTTKDLHSLQRDLGDWIAECGFPGIFGVSISIQDMPKIYAYVVKHYIFLRTSNMIDQFTEGLNSFGKLWDMVKANWRAFLPTFTNMQDPMNRGTFKALFQISWSHAGSRKREAEEETLYQWELVLNMIEGKETDLTFEELLAFVTGTDEVPALGFPQKPTINFYDQDVCGCRLPYAFTCMMGLFLPRGVRCEDELNAMLIRAVRDSVGFGKM